MRVLGLDGGGTKTILAMALPTGEVIETKNGPGMDPTAGPKWEQHLTNMLRPCPAVEAAVLGLAYFSEIPAISVRQTEIAQLVLGPRAEVVNDVAVAYEGALGGSDGVLVLSGTGSMAWARGPLGIVRSGGWGDVFGDEGSAFWIGRAALSRVSRHLDGRQNAPVFAKGILDALGLTGSDLIEWTYGQSHPRAAVAGLSRHVSALAGHDADAAQILKQAAGQLVELSRTAARTAGLAEGHAWSFAGGSFASPILLAEVTAGMGSDPMLPRLPPVGGAVIAAARRAGWTIDESFLATLAATMAAKILI